MILIALVLLIAVGPEQLPGVIRRTGRLVSQVRSMSEGLRRDFMDSMDEIDRASDPRKWADGGFDGEHVARSFDPQVRSSEPEDETAEDGLEPDELVDEVIDEPADDVADEAEFDHVELDQVELDEVVADESELDSRPEVAADEAAPGNGEEASLVDPVTDEVSTGNGELAIEADVAVEQEQ